MPLSRWFVIWRLVLASIYLTTTFEVSISTDYKDTTQDVEDVVVWEVRGYSRWLEIAPFHTRSYLPSIVTMFILHHFLILHPSVFGTPFGMTPMEFRGSLCNQKTTIIGLLCSVVCVIIGLAISIELSTLYICMWHTDIWTEEQTEWQTYKHTMTTYTVPALCCMVKSMLDPMPVLKLNKKYVLWNMVSAP